MRKIRASIDADTAPVREVDHEADQRLKALPEELLLRQVRPEKYLSRRTVGNPDRRALLGFVYSYPSSRRAWEPDLIGRHREVDGIGIFQSEKGRSQVRRFGKEW